LVLLGFGLLGLLGWDSVRAGQEFGWFSYTPLPPEIGYVAQQNTLIVASYSAGTPFGLGRFPAQGEAWAVLVTATLVATAVWYGWRARRSGSVRTYVAVAVAGGIAVPAGYVAAPMSPARSRSPWT
jgi:hypothetical protein